MATEDLFIIAIELGSSKVTGICGKKLPDGSIHVEAVVQEPSSTFIRNGMIYNMDKSTQCVTSIIKRLQEQLKRTVKQVYVGFGGQSIHSLANAVAENFAGEVTISKETVDRLLKDNLDADTGDRDILEVVPQEYNVGTQKQTDPIGVLSDYIEGNFLNIVARPTLRSNIDSCFEKVGIHVVEDKLVPLTVADEVLSDTEKRSGCVLVDFGADTTTVSVYKGNLLRFISVIPLGSAHITRDMMSLQLEEKDAEELKLAYGAVATELTEEEANVVIYTLPDGSTIKKQTLLNIVQARTEEILQNVKDQITDSGYGRDSLVAGAWLIGGGASLKDLTKAFTEITGFDKVRVVKNSRTTVHFAKNTNKNSDGQLLGAISLLAKGNQICTSSVVQEQVEGNIFSGNDNQSTNVATPPTEEPEKEPKKEEEVKEKKVKKEKPKKEGPSIFKKAMNRLKSISEVIVGEDE